MTIHNTPAPLILVLGATGTVGRLLVDELLGRGFRVRAVTRNPQTAALPAEVEAIQADLTDVSTLETAFVGVAAAHLITVAGEELAPIAHGDAIVEQALKAGVQHFTVLSSWDPGTVETALAERGAAWTALLPNAFMANALDWADEIRDGDRVRILGNGAASYVHEADIAAVAAVALTEPGHAGERYFITGPEVLSASRMVAQIAEAAARPVTYVESTETDERLRLASLGFDEAYVDFAIDLALRPPEEATYVSPVVEKVTGAPARRFSLWAQQNVDAFSARQP